MAEPLKVYIARYRELVRLKDPATMEKRHLAAQCPVCGENYGHPTLSNHWRTHSDGSDA